jgi:hypothetical protein
MTREVLDLWIPARHLRSRRIVPRLVVVVSGHDGHIARHAVGSRLTAKVEGAARAEEGPDADQVSDLGEGLDEVA